MRPLPLPPHPVPQSGSLAAAATLSLAIFAAVLVTVVPKFAEVFRQVKIPLPGTTLTLMRLSEFLTSHWWAAVLLLIGVYDALSRLSPKKADVARVLIPVVVVACIGWMTFALFAPLMGPLEGIGPRR